MDDDLPPRLKDTPRPSGGSAGKLPNMEIIINEYYALRGWNEQGFPEKETLERLQLSTVVK
jgi:aldehyde:ferredoxin oxidoreductase